MNVSQDLSILHLILNASAVVQAVTVGQELYEHVVHGVPGILVVTKKVGAPPVDGCAVLLVQLFEEFLVRHGAMPSRSISPLSWRWTPPAV